MYALIIVFVGGIGITATTVVEGLTAQSCSTAAARIEARWSNAQTMCIPKGDAPVSIKPAARRVPM
jgi:hypothetical protein